MRTSFQRSGHHKLPRKHITFAITSFFYHVVFAILAATTYTASISPVYGQDNDEGEAISMDLVRQIYEFSVTAEDIRRMKSATWLNRREVAEAVNFTNTETSPFPDTAYDVTIDPNASCYVVFRDQGKTTYDMVTAPTSSEPPESEFGAFLSHETPCGVCSNLQDLAVYLETPNLLNPVRLCGSLLFFSGTLNLACLERRIGFSDDCAAIWLYNTQLSRRECFALCIVHLFSPSNQEFGFINPCLPEEQCQNTINQGPACPAFQYEIGNEYRLNACLQCDECKAGPLFQKIAGRTRRGSGIQSGIGRPDIPEIHHNYFTAEQQNDNHNDR